MPNRAQIVSPMVNQTVFKIVENARIPSLEHMACLSMPWHAKGWLCFLDFRSLLYRLGNIIGSWLAIWEVMLYYAEVVLEVYLEFRKQSPKFILKTRMAQSARLNKSLNECVWIWRMSSKCIDIHNLRIHHTAAAIRSDNEMTFICKRSVSPSYTAFAQLQNEANCMRVAIIGIRFLFAQLGVFVIIV